MSSKLHVTISGENYPDLDPSMFNLDSTGEIALIFKVTGINRYEALDDMEGKDTVSIGMECDIKSVSVKKVTLEDAASRAADNYVKTQTTQAP